MLILRLVVGMLMTFYGTPGFCQNLTGGDYCRRVRVFRYVTLCWWMCSSLTLLRMVVPSSSGSNTVQEDLILQQYCCQNC